MKRGLIGVVTLLACCLFLGASATQALTPEKKCQFTRAKEKGKYEKCVQIWLAKCYGKNNCDQVKLSKCRVKYQNKWPKLQQLTGTTCDAPRFEDNGVSITDNLTGLIWEKKTTALGSGVNYLDPTDVDNFYTWTDSGISEDGIAFSLMLVNLNVNLFEGVAGWRIPTFAELQMILLPELYPCTTNPCIDPIFGPTQSAYAYWSSTTFASTLGYAWYVLFADGNVTYGNKGIAYYVRAVRGGL